MPNLCLCLSYLSYFEWIMDWLFPTCTGMWLDLCTASLKLKHTHACEFPSCFASFYFWPNLTFLCVCVSHSLISCLTCLSTSLHHHRLFLIQIIHYYVGIYILILMCFSFCLWQVSQKPLPSWPQAGWQTGTCSISTTITRPISSSVAWSTCCPPWPPPTSCWWSTLSSSPSSVGVTWHFCCQSW